MLEWHEDLYVSDAASEKIHKIIKKINGNKAVPGVYLLTYPINSRNIMDIFSALSLKQPVIRKRCPKIIGVAKGKDDAIELMIDIINETYQNTGSFQVKEYLENR